MAKTSAVERNKKREKLVERYSLQRARLRAAVRNRDLPAEDRFAAQIKLTKMPRDSAKSRVQNRCLVTGRSRAVYRKFKLCRITLRELASSGQIPGMVKSSW